MGGAYLRTIVKFEKTAYSAAAKVVLLDRATAYMSRSPLGPPWRLRGGGSTELTDLLQGDSLWTAVYGKVNFFWNGASLVKYGRFEKKLFSKNSLEKIISSFDEL